MPEDRLQMLMAILALVMVPLLIIEQQATDPTLLLVVWSLNLLIWLAFVAEYIYGLSKAADRWRFVRERWFDLAVILLSPPIYVPESLQGVRSLRALRVLRLGRLGQVLRMLRVVRVFAFMARAWASSRRVLSGHSFGYILLTTLLFVVGGGALFVLVEGRDLTLLDGIWWAVATLTTVGYGDVYPQTEWGRAIALVIILLGLGFMATLTANIAARFVEDDRQRQSQNEALLERLDAIAARLDRLEQRLGAAEQAAAAQQGPESPRGDGSTR